MSRRSHLIGGLLSLAGGLLIGYGLGAQATLGSVLSAINGFVNAVPYLPNLAGQLTTLEWYLAFGAVLIVLGLLLVVIGGSGGSRAAKQLEKKTAPAPQVPVRPPGSCKFCGSDLKGSKTYCPSCGRSQT